MMCRLVTRHPLVVPACGLVLLLAGAWLGTRTASSHGVVTTDATYVANLGLSKPGTDTIRRIPIRNTSRSEWRFSGASRSCDCIVGELDPTLAPGAEGVLTLTYHAPQAAGEISRSVELHFQGRTPPTLQLLLRGSVRPMWQAEPARLDFGRVTAGKAGRVRFRLTDYSGKPGIIGSDEFTSSHPWVGLLVLDSSATKDPSTGQSVVQYLIEAEAQPAADMPPREISGELIFHDPWREREPLAVGYSMELQSQWAADPPQVFFGVVSSGTQSQRSVLLRVNGDRPSPESVAISNPAQEQMEVKVCGGDAQALSINVSLKAPDNPGVLRYEVVLASDGLPSLKLPILAYVERHETQSPDHTAE